MQLSDKKRQRWLVSSRVGNTFRDNKQQEHIRVAETDSRQHPNSLTCARVSIRTIGYIISDIVQFHDLILHECLACLSLIALKPVRALKSTLKCH